MKNYSLDKDGKSITKIGNNILKNSIKVSDTYSAFEDKTFWDSVSEINHIIEDLFKTDYSITYYRDGDDICSDENLQYSSGY
jgi:hypothetical protein